MSYLAGLRRLFIASNSEQQDRGAVNKNDHIAQMGDYFLNVDKNWS